MRLIGQFRIERGRPMALGIGYARDDAPDNADREPEIVPGLAPRPDARIH